MEEPRSGPEIIIKQKPRIHIIGHGGTISMESTLQPDGTYTRMPAKSASELLAQTSRETRDSAQFTFTDFEREDSTNLNPYHWGKLAREIARVQESGEVDTIIVTHGTDTMAHHAGAISLAMGRRLKMPVIFTGSQKPMGMKGSDAGVNLEEAVMAAEGAKERGLNRTLVVFNDKVLLGSRSLKTTESRFDAFDSPSFPTLAEFVGSDTSLVWGPVAENMAKTDSEEGWGQDGEVRPQFDFDIVTIELTPGLNPAFPRALLETGICKGLIFKSFGGGNVPDKDFKQLGDAETNLIPVIEEAAHKYRVPVLVTTQFTGGNTKMDMYGPGKAALDAGAVATGDMTHAMSPVKLMWLLAQPQYRDLDNLRKGMLENFADEISTPKNK